MRDTSSHVRIWFASPGSAGKLTPPVGIRIFSLGLLAFQTMWLLLVLPGHTRGLVSWTPSCESQVVCCPADGKVARSPDGQPTPEQQKNCAVCYYAVGLTPPPVLDLYVPDLGLLKILPTLPAPIHAEQQHILTYYACGPPVVA